MYTVSAEVTQVTSTSQYTYPLQLGYGVRVDYDWVLVGIFYYCNGSAIECLFKSSDHIKLSSYLITCKKKFNQKSVTSRKFIF